MLKTSKLWALWLMLSVGMPVMADETDSLKVIFDFTTLTDQSGQYGGTLKNGAVLTTEGEEPVLSLGSKNGYFQFDASVGQFVKSFSDYTISLDVFVPQGTNIAADGPLMVILCGVSPTRPPLAIFSSVPRSRASLSRRATIVASSG